MCIDRTQQIVFLFHALDAIELLINSISAACCEINLFQFIIAIRTINNNYFKLISNYYNNTEDVV